MLRTVEIQPQSSTFIIIKAFNKYICYETCMGNVVKIRNQSAYGPINRISPLVPFLRERDNTNQFRLLYYEPDFENGLSEKPLPYILKGRSGTKFSFKEGVFKSTSVGPQIGYDMLVRGPRLYYCIESDGNFFLYDDDFGNPLMADIDDGKGNTYVARSKVVSETLRIINSLPKNATVYSLRVTKNGLVRGNNNFRRFGENTKEILEKTKKEKLTDKTRNSLIKKEIQKKKIEKLQG